MANVQIGLTPDLMKGKASEVRRIKTQYDEAMTNLNTLVLSLDEIWAGKGQESFTSRYNDIKPTLNAFSEMIEQYAGDLDFAADSMTETDETLAARNSR